jgi:TolB-like protein/Tfp pilus assembly protein PilF
MMAEARVDRRLAAILAADVAGYSRLMSVDEEGTLAALKACRRQLIDPKIAEHRGRIVKTTGDGALVEFVSAVDAVRCAMEIQCTISEHNAAIPEDRRIEFRIGINVGDIIVEGSDIYGDGVNIAARLEALAEPGGICVSGQVQENVEGKLNITFEDTGEQHLKNIARPVRVYRVRLDGAATTMPPALPKKPSIAVLPFQNLSGDSEQEYFADGVVEDIITALSRMRWLFVIARNSSFTYKGRAVDAKQVGHELGVRYLLEGSMRKAGTRVRISAQLIEAATGTHLWADRFDGAIEDIFDLQDQLTASVLSAIAPRLEQAEIERAKRKPTASLDAYDYFLRGMAHFHQWTREANNAAIRLFHRAVELDPDFASAYGLAAWCYVQRRLNGWVTDASQEIAEASRLARRAVELGKDDAVALCWGGHALAELVHDFDAGAAVIERALLLNPNLASGWYFSGWLKDRLGEPEVAIEHVARAMRLSPLDPLMFGMQTAMAWAHFTAGRYDEASSWADRAMVEQSNCAPTLRIAAASNALAGRLEKAQKAMARLREYDPTLRVSDLKGLSLRRADVLAKFVEGLRMAGLPE